MPETEGIHQFIEEHESFAELVAELEEENIHTDLSSLIEDVGKEIYETNRLRGGGPGPREMGWVLLCWEAHHQKLDEKEIPIQQ